MTPLWIVYVGLLLARIGAFVAVLPPFAGRTPRSVRAAFCMILTGFYLLNVAPSWKPEFVQKAIDVNPLVYGVAILREVLLGAAMGFAFALFLLPARIAGEFITLQIGLNAAQSSTPFASETSGPLTSTFEMMGGMLFLIADGHHFVLLALHESFLTLPLGGLLLPDLSPMLVGLKSSYHLGLLLAGPLALCLFLLSITLAIASRAAPQLNIYSIGFAIQVLVTLVGTLFFLPEIAHTLGVSIEFASESIHDYWRQ